MKQIPELPPNFYVEVTVKAKVVEWPGAFNGTAESTIGIRSSDNPRRAEEFNIVMRELAIDLVNQITKPHEP